MRFKAQISFIPFMDLPGKVFHSNATMNTIIYTLVALHVADLFTTTMEIDSSARTHDYASIGGSSIITVRHLIEAPRSLRVVSLK